MGAPDEAVLWARPVFSIGDVTYCWADVAAFARRGDDWARLLHEVRQAMACRRAGLVPPQAVVAAAARAFRYERRLITADETEAWLARRALDVDTWMDHIRREVLREQHAASLDDLVAAHPVPDDDVLPVVWAHGWCTGQFEGLSMSLAQRVAAHVRSCGGAPADLADLDDALERFRDAVVTPEGVHAVITARRLDWIRVELDEAVFGTEGAAREAGLSMRYDGLSMNEVRALSGAAGRARTTRLEQLHEEMRAAVLSAGEGTVVGPVRSGDGFVMARIESKTLPSIEDPDVRDRAAAVLVSTALRHEVEERVRWHDR